MKSSLRKSALSARKVLQTLGQARARHVDPARIDRFLNRADSWQRKISPQRSRELTEVLFGDQHLMPEDPRLITGPKAWRPQLLQSVQSWRSRPLPATNTYSISLPDIPELPLQAASPLRQAYVESFQRAFPGVSVPDLHVGVNYAETLGTPAAYVPASVAKDFGYPKSTVLAVPNWTVLLHETGHASDPAWLNKVSKRQTTTTPSLLRVMTPEVRANHRALRFLPHFREALEARHLPTQGLPTTNSEYNQVAQTAIDNYYHQLLQTALGPKRIPSHLASLREQSYMQSNPDYMRMLEEEVRHNMSSAGLSEMGAPRLLRQAMGIPGTVDPSQRAGLPFLLKPKPGKSSG